MKTKRKLNRCRYNKTKHRWERRNRIQCQLLQPQRWKHLQHFMLQVVTICLYWEELMRIHRQLAPSMIVNGYSKYFRLTFHKYPIFFQPLMKTKRRLNRHRERSNKIQHSVPQVATKFLYWKDLMNYRQLAPSMIVNGYSKFVIVSPFINIRFVYSFRGRPRKGRIASWTPHQDARKKATRSKSSR